MSQAIRATVMIGLAAGALITVSGNQLYAQGADPNAAPNPYKMQENWAQLPESRKFGAAIKVQIDHSDGKSIWVFDRCGATECTNSTLAPMQKFDSSGKFQKAIGAEKFAIPHGFYVDREGNAWGGDQIARNGKGADLIKFAPDGKVLMILGKPGMPGNGPGYLSTGSAVVVAPNGEIYVADGHGEGTNDRIVKFSKDGKFITAWGKHGKGPGEFETPHGIALDSMGNASTSPTAPTTAFRFSNRTASSLPNGSSSGGRATLPSTRMT
jgi:6-bladed beta-propeller